MLFTVESRYLENSISRTLDVSKQICWSLDSLRYQELTVFNLRLLIKY